MSPRVDVVVFAIALTVFGLVALALLWSTEWAYEAIARANGVSSASFVVPSERSGACGQAVVVDLTTARRIHGHWATYVVGLTDVPLGPACPLWTQDEYAHMADVRNVFRAAELAAVAALGVAAFRLMHAWRRSGALRLLRDGALTAAGLVAVIGVAAALAFDQLFLLFHEIFFPQGNFLFDPATSNLVRLYPEWYWVGVTAGVGVSFIGAALLTALTAHLALRRAATTYTRAA